MTQAQFAELLGVSSGSYVSRLERGMTVTTTIENLVRLLERERRRRAKGSK